MVDDERHVDGAQEVEIDEHVGRIEQKGHVPAQRPDALQHAANDDQIRGAAQMAHESEAHTANARLMQRQQVLVRRAVIHRSHAAIAPAARGERCERHVAGGATGLHDHGMLEAEMAMHCHQPFRVEFGELRARAIDVAMDVTGTRRRRKSGLPQIEDGLGHGAPPEGRGTLKPDPPGCQRHRRQSALSKPAKGHTLAPEF